PPRGWGSRQDPCSICRTASACGSRRSRRSSPRRWRRSCGTTPPVRSAAACLRAWWTPREATRCMRSSCCGRCRPTSCPPVRSRGAPLAAAELLELALELGGDSSLKLRAAEHHLDAGDVPRAQALLEAATSELGMGEDRARALVLLADLRMRDDSFVEARELL